ncbi:MAG TPA: ERCC4 domain-containing protein [Gemmata sp.]
MSDKPQKLRVLQDSREQRGWGPDLDSEQFGVEVATLSTGDYTIDGLHDRLAIERKSLGDFVSTVTREWLRFRKELYRLAGFDVAAVVVEANVEDVMEHRYESDAHPSSVMGRAHGIFLDHGVPVFFWGPRPVCVAQVERFLLLADKKLRGAS